MNSLIDAISTAANWFVEALIFPFRSFSSAWGLAVVSLVAGVLLLLLYGRFSSQRAIRWVKNKIFCAFSEALLFRHDLKLSLQAQARMLFFGGVYFALAIPPMLILIIPCIFIMAQLELRYGASSLRVGEQVVLKIKMNKGISLADASIILPAGLEQTAEVRSPTAREAAWRIRAQAPGRYMVGIKNVVGEVSVPLIVEGKDTPLNRRVYSKLLYRFLFPGGPDLLHSPMGIAEIGIDYRSRSFSVFGFSLHWIVIFFVLSLASGLVASKIFKVEV